MLYIHDTDTAKWLFLINVMLITLWSFLEFKFINDVIKSNKTT